MTIRRTMLVVVGLALVLGLVMPAFRVWFDPAHRVHYHYYRHPRGDLHWGHSNPFWPRYFATLTGRTWDSDAHCRATNGGNGWTANVPGQFVREAYSEVGSGDNLDEIKRRP